METVKLKKVVSRIDKDFYKKGEDRIYHRYDITIPGKIIEDELQWNEKTNLKFEVKNDKLVIEKE